MLTGYVKYLKENPPGYWFKRRWYGWGWVPARWQGWATVLLFFIWLGLIGRLMADKPEPTGLDLVWFFANMVAAISFLLAVALLKGEKPKWSWGGPKK